MTGQVALVTGSSRGIGRAAALELAREGFDIAVNSNEDGEDIERTMDDIRSLGRQAFRAIFDVSDIEGHTEALSTIETAMGPVTTLVNNAGVGVLSRGDPLDVSSESWDRCLSVNAKAMFFLTQAWAKRRLVEPRDPSAFYSVINVTSANAVAVAVPRAEYCASKAAAAMVSKTFAARLGAESIAVYDVQPGLISTEMTASVIDDYQRRAEDGLCLMPRVGQPEDIARVIASLATSRLPYTTGQTISVDGGMLVPRF